MIHRIEEGKIVYSQGGCTGTRLYEAAGTEYVHLAIEPGNGIPEHTLPFPVSFCVLAGEGILQLEGKELAVKASEMAECPPDAPRGWKNMANNPLEILVIKHIDKSSD